MREPPRTVVIGAGICGLSAALWLRRAGQAVTLIDREGPGAGASFGNAGILAQWAVVPVNAPGLLRQGLGYMADPDSPLFLRWRHLPRLAPWLMRFAARANDRDTRATARALLPLIGDSLEQHRALARGTVAEKWLASSEIGFAYPGRADYAADSYGWTLKRDAGFEPEVIEGPAVQEAEPALGPEIGCLALMKGHGHILDPGAYMADLARALEAEGGRVLRAEARDIVLEDGRVTRVETDAGPLPCAAAVLAAGIWSGPIARKLGLAVPMVAERGYHLHFTGARPLPRRPLMITRGKFGATPMADGLRCAGLVELGGLDPRPSPRPLKVLRRHAARAFPGLAHEGAREWMGMRPSTADSLPVVGEIGRTGVHAAFGHQHVGLTAGPKTGRLVADMIAGRRPNLDMAPYAPARFGRGRPGD